MKGTVYKHYDVEYGDEIYYTLGRKGDRVHKGVVLSGMEVKGKDYGYSGDEDRYLYIEVRNSVRTEIRVYGETLNSIRIVKKESEEKKKPRIQFFLGVED